MWLCATFSPLVASSGSTSRHDTLYPETCVWLGEGCHVTLSVLILALTFSSVGAKITGRQETQVVTVHNVTLTSAAERPTNMDPTRLTGAVVAVVVVSQGLVLGPLRGGPEADHGAGGYPQPVRLVGLQLSERELRLVAADFNGKRVVGCGEKEVWASEWSVCTAPGR